LQICLIIKKDGRFGQCSPPALFSVLFWRLWSVAGLLLLVSTGVGMALILDTVPHVPVTNA
jgi:hypothetical protein